MKKIVKLESLLELENYLYKSILFFNNKDYKNKTLKYLEYIDFNIDYFLKQIDNDKNVDYIEHIYINDLINKNVMLLNKINKIK